MLWAGLWLLLWGFALYVHSGYMLFDNAITVVGLTSTVLGALSYIDFVYLQIFGLLIRIVLYAQMLGGVKPIGLPT